MESTTETLADRLNQEPVIFRGSSSSELGMILLCAVVFWVPFALIVTGLLGALAMGLGLASLGVLATVFIGATCFQKIKRGRPDNYYQHRMMILLHQLGLRSTPLIRHQGAWSLGRTD